MAIRNNVGAKIPRGGTKDNRKSGTNLQTGFAGVTKTSVGAGSGVMGGGTLGGGKGSGKGKSGRGGSDQRGA